MRAAVLSWIAVALLLGSPGSALAADGQSVADATYDIAILRTLGTFSTVVGGALFVPAALMTLPSGRDGLDEAWGIFVRSPYQSTFERPLGDF
jgi:hypothetical protein